jgi:hypothetical protein
MDIHWPRLQTTINTTINAISCSQCAADKCFNRIALRYYWVGYFEEERNFVLSYPTCQYFGHRLSIGKLSFIASTLSYKYTIA